MAPITLIDELPDGLSPVSASGEGWSCDVAGRVVTCVRDADLAVGEFGVVSIVVLVSVAGGELIVNVAEAFGMNPEVLSLGGGNAVGAIEALVAAAAEDLPSTGRNLDRLVWLALLFLVLGSVMAVLGRRRRSCGAARHWIFCSGIAEVVSWLPVMLT